jgi:hypothetical protein
MSRATTLLFDKTVEIEAAKGNTCRHPINKRIGKHLAWAAYELHKDAFKKYSESFKFVSSPASLPRGRAIV